MILYQSENLSEFDDFFLDKYNDQCEKMDDPPFW